MPAPDAIDRLRALGLTLPGAHSKSPWPGHADLAVDDKTFAYLSAPGDPPSASFKLPFSAPMALALPYAQPTAYGLGRSGWVSLDLAEAGEPPPLAMLEAWLIESYRAQAPKRLLAELDLRGGPQSGPQSGPKSGAGGGAGAGDGGGRQRERLHKKEQKK